MFDQNNTLERLGVNREEVMTSLSISSPVHTVFLSGSVIEGYGNAESDLDVFVIYSEELPKQQADYVFGPSTIFSQYTPTWHLDIESWPRQALSDVAERIATCPHEDWNACANLSLLDIALAHRIRVGVPIDHPDQFYEIHDLFDYAHLSRVMMTKTLILYNGVTGDLAGAVASKQSGTAFLLAHRVIQLAVDAWIAALGDTNPKEKWRPQKLDKIANSTVSNRYWELEMRGLHTQEEIMAYATECLNFANELVITAQQAKA